MTKPKPREQAADGRPEPADPTGAEDGATPTAGEEQAPTGEAELDGAAAAPPVEPAGQEQAEAAEQEQADEDPVAKVEAERDEYLELAQRAQADFENYRKRAAKDMAAAGERAKIGLVRDLLPVVDNLERALASADGDSALSEGVRLVLTDLHGVLQREGVSPLEPEGEQFDPTFHEALSTRSEDGAEAGVVLDVVEKGYRLGDTVIRPARVVVSA